MASSVDINCTDMTVAGNEFYGTPISGISKAQFPDSTYFSSRPSGAEVFVQPNRYEAGRANVTVYNWPKQDSVDVDLAGALSIGSDYEIRNAQDYFGNPVLSGTYTGGPSRSPWRG